MGAHKEKYCGKREGNERNHARSEGHDINKNGFQGTFRLGGIRNGKKYFSGSINRASQSNGKENEETCYRDTQYQQ